MHNSPMISLENRDSDAIKAISIVVIVLHNFLHLTNHIRENEHFLNPDRIWILFAHIQNQPIGVMNYIFSYFGWYFVVPFIFISGYGLTKKYSKAHGGLLVLSATAIFKTSVLLVFGALYIWLTGYVSLKEALAILYHKLATADNIVADRVFSGVGPWWYFSLAIQLYLIFPLIYKIVTWRRVGLLAVLLPSYVVIYTLYLFAPKLNTFGTALGHAPVLALGVFMAYHEITVRKGVLAGVAILALVVFCLSQRYHAFFPLTYISFMVLFLLAYRGVRKWVDGPLWITIGRASAFIFVLNGPIRAQTQDLVWLGSARYPNFHEAFIFSMSLMHLLAVLAVSMMFYVGLDDVMRRLSAKFSNVLHDASR